VTQSTLSVGIAELERVLGALLVERSKRSVRFTPIGEEVVARARGMIRAGEDLVAVAQDAREPLVGAIRLAVIPTVAPFMLPCILSGVGAEWPQLRLFVREMLTAPACEALHRGIVDCVLLALPAECGEIDVCDIITDRLLLAMPADNGQAVRRVRTAIPIDEIDGTRLLLLEDGHCLREHALATCRVAEPAPDARFVASTLHTLVGLVDAGLGITLLPQMAITAGILTGSRVHARAIAGDGAERRITLAWRKRHPREAEFHLLAATIRDAAQLASESCPPQEL
jgi:LysR family hydrogen peroxide-inducible transcriptional activator